MSRGIAGHIAFAVGWAPVLAVLVFVGWALLSGLAHFEAATHGTTYIIPQTEHAHYADELRETVRLRQEFGLEPVE